MILIIQQILNDITTTSILLCVSVKSDCLKRTPYDVYLSVKLSLFIGESALSHTRNICVLLHHIIIFTIKII